jgi:3-deoxy-D-manno-octulosonate 8-phosphate phosphatase (KDO 8-P phosphatase)
MARNTNRKLSLKDRARRVRLLLMDVDGVLTDGRIYYLPAGYPPAGGSKQAGAIPQLIETKTFHSRDGFGIHFAHVSGLRTGLISGRASPIVEYRARELGIHYVRQNARQKLAPYLEILKEAGVTDNEVCYIGDDLVDLPVLVRVGLAVSVGDGHPLLLRHVHYVTREPGGHGAVRETIELILGAQGKLKPIIDQFAQTDE